MEFHISSQARKKYKFKASLFRYDKTLFLLIFMRFAASRISSTRFAVNRAIGSRYIPA